MRFVHPISLLSFGTRRLPPDFSLEAADCLSLYRAFESCVDDLGFDLEPLNPTRFFEDSSRSFLKQKDILRYEAALVAHISTLMASAHPQDQNSALNTVIKRVSDHALEKVDQGYIPDAKRFYTNLITLLSDMHASGDLVSIYDGLEAFIDKP